MSESNDSEIGAWVWAACMFGVLSLLVYLISKGQA